MKEPKKYLQLIQFFLKKRDLGKGGVDGLFHPFSFTFEEVLEMNINDDLLMFFLEELKYGHFLEEYKIIGRKITVYGCITKKLSEIRSIVEELLGMRLAPRNTLTPQIIQTPPGTEWEDMEIKFNDIFTISISADGQFICRKTYEDLGFVQTGTKDKKNDKQWEFLTQLAIILQNPQHTQQIDNILEAYFKTREICQKIKSNLSKALKRFLPHIKGKPFPKGSYQPKFKLYPALEDPEIYGTKGIIRDEQGDSVMEGWDDTVSYGIDPEDLIR